jgi:hypothetical protein
MKQITVRCSDDEYDVLVAYCTKTERTQNDVLRELVRKLTFDSGSSQAVFSGARKGGESSSPLSLEASPEKHAR